MKRIIAPLLFAGCFAHEQGLNGTPRAFMGEEIGRAHV